MRRRAISLVEVMVVAAILALLAAIGFSATAGSREKARQVVCVNQLKQIYSAMTLYSADHEGAPSMQVHTSMVFTYGNFREALQPYLGDRSGRLLFCPDYPGTKVGQLLSSYELRWLAFAPRPPGDDEDWYAGLVRDFNSRPDTYPMIICKTHDDVYYSQVEGEMDSGLVGAYTVELRFDGSVHMGLRTSPRRPRR